MMILNKKELRILSLEFRTIVNRLLNCNQENGMSLLKRFLAFIDTNEIISDFVKAHINIEDFKPVRKGTAFMSMGDTKQEEISNTYQYLKYATENFSSFYYDITRSYAITVENSVREFMNRIILPFVYYIETFLTEIAVNMGSDEDTKYAVSVVGGAPQVVPAGAKGADKPQDKAGSSPASAQVKINKLV